MRYGLLLAEAVPELYRTNAFRVTQLPVNVTQREVSRQVDKIRMADKIGVPVDLKGGLLPLASAPDSDTLRAAVQRLRDPEKRLIDELFWFWPLHDGVEHDVALKALEIEGTGAASRLWQSAADEGGRRGAIALHNLAILSHAAALDAELDDRHGKLSDAGRQALKTLWSTAFQHWGELRKSEGFADVLRERVRDVGDPRLDESTVANVRKTLAEALASISARLAVADFDAGNSEACGRVFAQLRASGLPQSDVRRAVRDALGPVRARLKASGESFEQKPDGAPREILVAARRFLEQTERLLLLVDMALPEGDATRAGLHDDVALTVMGMTIAYANGSEDFRGSLAWLERAAKIAEGEAALHRIAENTSTARENADAEDAYDRAVARAGSPTAYSRGAGRSVAAAGASVAVGGLGCLFRTFGVFLVIALIGGAISLAGKACDATSSSSSGSGSTYSQSSTDSGSGSSASGTPDVTPSVNYTAIRRKIRAMIAYNNSLPATLSSPKPSVATRFAMYEGAIETWAALNDPDKETRGLCRKAGSLARAAAVLYRDPSSDSAWSAWKASIGPFNRAWRLWGKTH